MQPCNRLVLRSVFISGYRVPTLAEDAISDRKRRLEKADTLPVEPVLERYGCWKAAHVYNPRLQVTTPFSLRQIFICGILFIVSVDTLR